MFNLRDKENWCFFFLRPTLFHVTAESRSSSGHPPHSLQQFLRPGFAHPPPLHRSPIPTCSCGFCTLGLPPPKARSAFYKSRALKPHQASLLGRQSSWPCRLFIRLLSEDRWGHLCLGSRSPQGWASSYRWRIFCILRKMLSALAQSLFVSALRAQKPTSTSSCI